jgi:1-acyl-sn-glycerol-3-phosphate acyltransferase
MLRMSPGVKEVHSPLTAALRLIGLVSWILLWTPALILFRSLGRGHAVIAVGKVIYRGLVRIVGIRIEIVGEPCPHRPVLFVANHCSYFDIVVLGARLDASFVAKQEVAGWPGIGPMARIAGTVFVERRARHSRTQRDAMSDLLGRGNNSLILFPEGTSSNGQSVLPFKSSLFSVVEGGLRTLPVQPVSVSYTRLDGLPLGRGWRSHYAWYGDMELASHLWMALGLGRVTVTLVFHPPVTLDAWGSRKALAEHCEKQVRRGVIAANCGRTVDFAAASAS